MHGRTTQKLLALGFDTDLIQKCDQAGLTVTALAGMTQTTLDQLGFNAQESATIINKVNRQPIPRNILANVKNDAGAICCYCADGNASRPYQIHHITEYHLTQDNSEDNLLLVCPTHHTAIHRSHIPTDDQKLKRTQWKNIWSIAKGYHRQGLVFPFGAFEYYDYSMPPNIIEVFDFAGPSPSTCAHILEAGNKVAAQRILDEEHMLIVTGVSGSGKTTFAKGVAGNLAGYSVYNYSISRNVNAANEILTFLSQAVQPVVVILDNANVHLTEGQIETILRGAGVNKKLIIIQTPSGQPADDNIEQHFVKAVFPITWPTVQRGIKDNLLAHEHEVITYLSSHHFSTSAAFGVGLGHLQEPLAHVIDNYARSVQTAYQFFYLFADGIERLDTLQVDLASRDQLDVILLYLAINHLARVENGTTLTEITAQYGLVSIFRSAPVPDNDWVKTQLDILNKKRVIRIERGRYNTVHREFAKQYIDHCYIKRRIIAEEMLQPIFSDAARVDELAPLWAWIRDTNFRGFIRQWATGMTTEEWQLRVLHACEKGIAVVSLLADSISQLTFGSQLAIQNAFEPSINELAKLISQDQQLHVYYLQRLISALSRLEKDVIKPMLEKADQAVIAQLIKNSEPAFFDEASRAFYQIKENYPEWIKDIALQFNNADFDRIIDRIQRGGISELQSVVEFQRTYIGDIYKSQYFVYLGKFAALLKNCPLKDIRYSGTLSSGFFEIYLYPDQIQMILNSLDIQQLSQELAECPPRDWDNLGMLAMLADYVITDVFTQIVDGIDLDKMIANIAIYYHIYNHELRVFQYLLAYGSPFKRQMTAQALRPYIQHILENNELKDSDDVFKAYCYLDASEGASLAAALQITMPEKHEKPDHGEWDVFRKQIQEMEKTESDYPMSRIRNI